MTKYDTSMLRTAFTFAEQSSCKRLKVGSVLAREGRILATGYNGTIRGMDNCCEDTEPCNCNESATDGTTFDPFCPVCRGTGLKLKTSDFTLHAEQNLISFCARKGIPTESTTLYITHSPCKQCSKLIAQSGITEVVYATDYRDPDGIHFLQSCGISTRKVSLNA